MRLLVVGHTYITAFAQAKYVAMKKLRGDLAVRLVVPPVVHHPFGAYRPELAAELAPGDLVVIRSFGGMTNMSYVLDPIAVSALMRVFVPTHVHVEEDPHSAVGATTAWLASRYCPNAVLSFFIWDNLNRMPPFPVGLVKRRLTRFGLARARLVVCGSGEARSLLAAKHYRGVSTVIPQVGLDPVTVEVDSHRAEPATESKRVPTIGYFGRLVAEKGIGDLLEALKQLRDMPWKLIIYGNGPLNGEIETRWLPLFGDRLTCHGAMPHAEVARKLAALDVFVLPSYTIPTWKEQFGLTLAQAMLAGCACVGSSSGAIPEVLAGAGLVFPERSVPALASALRRLLESAAERRRFGAEARAVALAQYTNEAIASRYLQAFDAVAN